MPKSFRQIVKREVKRQKFSGYALGKMTEPRLKTRMIQAYLKGDCDMRGEKLAQAQEALHIFLGQIEGDQERVGLIEFETQVRTTVRLDELGANRAALQLAVDNLVAAGDTAKIPLAADIRNLGKRHTGAISGRAHHHAPEITEDLTLFFYCP